MWMGQRLEFLPRGRDVSRAPSWAGPDLSHAHVPALPPGVILARYGNAWREQRRFSLSTLRNFGLGKKSLEQWVTEEASFLCATFADQAGERVLGQRDMEVWEVWRGLGKKRWRRRPTLHRPLPGRPFSPKDLLNKAVSNVIASLTFGYRFEYKDPRIVKLLDMMEDMLKEESSLVRQVREGSSVEAASVLQRVPPGGGRAFWERDQQGKSLGSEEMADTPDVRGPRGSAHLGEGGLSPEGSSTHWYIYFRFIILGSGPGESGRRRV